MDRLAAKLGAGFLSLSAFSFERAYAQETEPTSDDNTSFVVSISIEDKLGIPVPALAELISNQSYQALPLEDRATAAKLFPRLSDAGQGYFLTLLEMNSYQSSQKILLQQDFFGGKLIDTLELLTTQKLDPKIEARRHELIDAMLYLIIEPGTTNQGYRGVCGASMLYGLNVVYPAESARLLLGLTSERGEVNLLMPGKVLTRAPYSLDTPDYAGRSLAEQILLSSLIDLGNGMFEHYCDICDVSYSLVNGYSKYGLDSQYQAAVYRALYNLSEKHCVIINLEGHAIPDWLEETYLPGLIPASLDWSFSQATSVHGTTHKTEQKTEQSGLVQAHELLGAPYHFTAMGRHRVTILDIKDGRVYFHNMQGSLGYPDGTELQNPPRRVEDMLRGIQSMDLKEFNNRVNDLIIPFAGKPIPKPIVP